jgi:hypothetical protein
MSLPTPGNDDPVMPAGEDDSVTPIVDAGGGSAEAGGPISDSGEPRRDGGVPSRDGGVMASPGCALDGRFALRVAFDVGWVGTEFASIVPIVSEGEGALTILTLMELSSAASGLDVKFRQCDAVVPEFTATISRERYQTRFDHATWDARSMPMFSSTAALACREPGCAVNFPPLSTLVGAALSSPTAKWPASARAGQWPDDDGDEDPGIAAVMLGPSDGPYAYPPLDLLSSRRVRDLMLGLRLVVGLDGALQSCDVLQGETRQGSIETRAAGCRATRAPFPCSTTELGFLNDNLPVWTVKKGRFEAQRLPAAADCSAVRAAFAGPKP